MFSLHITINTKHPLKRKEILPFVKTQMDLKGSMLHEMYGRDIIWSHLNVESKKKKVLKLIDIENRLVISRGGGDWVK